MDCPRKVEVVSKRLLLDAFFKVEEATVRYEKFNGHLSGEVKRLKLDRGNSVAVLLQHVDSKQVMLVEQFKYPTFGPTDGWIVETLAGMIDPGESAEDAARRETIEETGYAVHSLEHIATFFVSPGGSSERIALYFAEVRDADKIAEGGGLSGEGEDIRLRVFQLDELLLERDRGKIADAKTLIAIQWLERRS
jgi:ADP-ribose pyrophosphatase